jgi:DNA-directed RNA polymerase subunit RPC12/RpoP
MRSYSFCFWGNGYRYRSRGVDRDINIMHDEKGDYIECPTCGAKHKIKYFPSTPGGVMQWSIDGLRE